MRAEHRVDFLSCPFVVVIETSICHYSPHTHLFVLLTCQHKSFNYMLSLATELNKQPRQGWLIAQGLAVEAGRRRPFCFVPRIPILSAKSLVKCSTCDLQYGLHMRGAAQSLRGSHQLPPMPRTRKPISKISFLGLASLALLFSQRSIRPGCFHCALLLCHCDAHISFALPCFALSRVSIYRHGHLQPNAQNPIPSRLGRRRGNSKPKDGRIRVHHILHVHQR